MRAASDGVGVPARPLLPGFFRVIPMSPHCLQLRSAGRVVRFTADGIGAFGPDLLSALDGRSTPAELAERFQLDTAVVNGVLRRLHRDGLVADAAGAEEAAGDGVAAGNPAAAEVFAELGRDPQEVAAALRRSKVAVAGLGPVARLAAQQLAAAGVGQLVMADDRVVSAFDHACAPSASSAAGRPRTEVAAEECAVAARGGPGGVAVSVAASLTAAMEGCDLVMVEVDEAGAGAEAANAACLAAGTTALFHEVGTFETVVGPAIGPWDGPCWACARQRRRGHLRYHDEHVACEQAVRDGTVAPRRAPLLGGYAALVSGLVSTEALSVVARFRDPSTRLGVLVADLRTLAVRREEVLALPDCPACRRGEEEVVPLA